MNKLFQVIFTLLIFAAIGGFLFSVYQKLAEWGVTDIASSAARKIAEPINDKKADERQKQADQAVAFKQDARAEIREQQYRGLRASLPNGPVEQLRAAIAINEIKVCPLL